jgi:type IV pilus assembly protein PilZ
MLSRAEQRRSHRVPIEVPVEFTSRDSWEKVPGVSKDISLGGMFIETAFPAAFGVAVFVGFTLPGHRKPMLVSGIVRWTSAGGMGVQFGSLGARETHAITELERERGSSPPNSR